MTCGIHGMSFLLQSAKWPPPVLEERILAFIEDFYHKWLNPEDPETFEKYKKGTLNRLKAKPSSLEIEADNLFGKLSHFSQNPTDKVAWNFSTR